MDHFICELREAYGYKKEIKELFEEYTNMLVENEPEIADYLKIQNFTYELNNLEEKYGLPEGRLYIAFIGTEAAGCIGFRKISSECCEMKRLYIRPRFRGLKLADQFMEHIIAEAKTAGYQFMLLDTMPFLKNAISLYRKFGFYEIEAYHDSPIGDTVYMRLDLSK